MGLGGEGCGSSMAGFERLEMDVVFFGRLDAEHEVDPGGDGGGAAEAAGTVGVVDEEHGGAAVLCEAAQVVEQGLDGEDGVLVAAAEDTREGVDDDQLGLEGERTLDEVVCVFFVA